MTRAAHPQLTFADLEFIRQGIDMDENLKKISEFLDAQPDRRRIHASMLHALLQLSSAQEAQSLQ